MQNKIQVIAVRVSGGHLCEAEAPTEPAGETAARRAAIRSSFKGITDSFAPSAQNDKPFSYFNHRKMRGNPFSFLRVLRILSRLPLLRCPKVVIRLEREQLFTAASAVARFFQHCSESNVTRNDKKLTGYAMNVKS